MRSSLGGVLPAAGCQSPHHENDSHFHENDSHFQRWSGQGYALSVWMNTHNVSNKYHFTSAQVIRATGVYSILIENDSHYHNICFHIENDSHYHNIYFHVLVAK